MLIGLYIRHIKAYKGINYIPVGNEYNFNSYIGNNGIGKSSILQALDSFFNNKEWQINKSALIDGIKGKSNTPFITPIFLIKKEDLQKDKAILEIISDFFWGIEDKKINPAVKGSMKEFYDLKDSLIEQGYKKEDYYLFVAGEKFSDEKKSIYFSSFHKEEEFRKIFLEYQISKIDASIGKLGLESTAPEVIKLNSTKVRLERDFNDREIDDVFVNLILKENKVDLLANLKNLYSYIYIPVEIDIEQFTKIETEDMQKVFDKQIIVEVRQALKGTNIDSINTKLDTFIDEIAEILNKDYFYDTGDKSKKNITENDIVEKVLEAYFQKRILLKGKKGDGSKRKVSELSAGEKRQALINLIYAFLKRGEEREKKLIIGLDEPENSLNVSLCYEQFEKLKEISNNNQILITTHWYGFLPIISQGYGHFLNPGEKENIDFETYDLYQYRSQIKKSIEDSKGRIPGNLELKSINDLVQSIYSSVKNIGNAYNWIICEGISEKIYFEYFLEEKIKESNIHILPVGGESKVREIFDYLFLPIKKEKSDNNGKIYCIVDTDVDKPADGYSDNSVSSTISIVRLSNKDKEVTKTVKYDSKEIHPTEIENSLVPHIFIKTLEEFPDELKALDIDTKVYDITDSSNTDFQDGFELKPSEAKKIKELFNNNSGVMKIRFALKYIEVSRANNNEGIPGWINDIDSFFKKQKPKKNTKEEEVKNKPEEVKAQEVESIFERKIDKKISPTEQIINLDELIDKVKSNGGKAALTMTIKGANFDLRGNTLHITTKTKIALSTLEKTINREILQDSLKDLGLQIDDIILI